MTDHGDVASFVHFVQSLALAKSNRELIDSLKQAARKLVGSDGVTVVFQDGDFCFYVAEDAMAPLFAPARFPIDRCISGWVMKNASSVVIPDIYVDARIPIELYRPTFIKSLGMVPIRSREPIGALGFYWANPHTMSDAELKLAQALADTASTALSNIAHQETLEQRVLERTEQLRLTNADLQLFAGRVAHDLRSPLTVLRSNARYLLHTEGVGETEQHETLSDIFTATEHMASMLDGLLALSRVTSAPVERRAVDLSGLAEQLARDLRRESPGREVSFDIQPRLSAQADEPLMRIVLGNLLGNAWKYTGHRSRAHIRFAQTRTDAGEAFVVEDDGAGFDSGAGFAPFKRFHAAADFPGTGLGLTTVQRALTRLGGRLWAQSQRDAGSRFYFQLPDAGEGRAPWLAN